MHMEWLLKDILKEAAKFPPPFHIAKKLSLPLSPGRRPEVYCFEKLNLRGLCPEAPLKKAWDITLKTKRLSQSLQMNQWDPPGFLSPLAARTWAVELNILPTIPVHSYPTHHTLSGKTLEDHWEILRSTNQRPNDVDFWGYSEQTS